jgi:hypothetical protein
MFQVAMVKGMIPAGLGTEAGTYVRPAGMARRRRSADWQNELRRTGPIT